jgi:hypothetical protein
VIVDSIEARTAWYSSRGIFNGGVDIFAPQFRRVIAPT